jgi:hypothetical protein
MLTLSEKPTEYSVPTSPHENTKQSIVEYIDRLIGEGRWGELQNRRLAETMGYSVRQFQDVFLELFRLTPHQWILQRRLDRSRALLIARYSVSFVAFKLGFADQSHFSKRFRERFGCLPSEVSAGIISWGDPPNCP